MRETFVAAPSQAQSRVAVWGTLGGAVVTLLGIIVIAGSCFHAFLPSLGHAVRTLMVEQKLDIMAMTLDDLETSQRKALSGGKAKSPRRIAGESAILNRNLTTVKNLLYDDPGQLKRLAALKRTLDRFLDSKTQSLLPDARRLIWEIKSEEYGLLSRDFYNLTRSGWIDLHASTYGNLAALFLTLGAALAIWRILGELRDFSFGERRLNEALGRRSVELESAVKELDALSYMISHDLRTPAGQLASMADILERKYAARLTGDGLEFLIQIRRSAEKMRRMIEALLAFSRAGRANMHIGTVPIAVLVRDIVSSLKPQIEDREVRFKIGNLPDAQGDPVLLHQVFTNLLGNAVKYSANTKKAVIEVGSLNTPDEQGNRVYFVKDNGAGFDMRNAHKLFEVFERLHTEGEFEGSGVGLAIVKRILERHGGRIWAEGKPGVGATFHFTIAAQRVGRSQQLPTQTSAGLTASA